MLSKALGKPVRVQWMRADDLQWSTQSSAAYSDIRHWTGCEAARSSPMKSTITCRPCRMTGRSERCWRACPRCRRPVKRQMVSIPPPTVFRTIGFTTRLPTWTSAAHGTWQVGQKRVAAQRRPARSQHAHARAVSAKLPAGVAISEAAALAGADATAVPHRPCEGRAA